MIPLLMQNYGNLTHIILFFPKPLKIVGTTHIILYVQIVPQSIQNHGNPITLFFWNHPLVTLDWCIWVHLTPTSSVFYVTLPIYIVSMINPFICSLFPSITLCIIIWRTLLSTTHQVYINQGKEWSPPLSTSLVLGLSMSHMVTKPCWFLQ